MIEHGKKATDTKAKMQFLHMQGLWPIPKVM